MSSGTSESVIPDGEADRFRSLVVTGVDAAAVESAAGR
jgi:hypothetical protein